MISTIAVPTNTFEIPRILNNFWLWDQDAFQPGLLNGHRPRLLLCFNNDDAAAHEPTLVKAFQNTSHVKEAFDKLDFLYLDLRGERDLYIRDDSLPPPNGGYKVGPNNQFFELVDRIAGTDDYVFLMETDCVPIQPGWLPALQGLVQGPERFWIKGSPYCGEAVLPGEFARHINGNAIYAVGDPDFQEFVQSAWRPGVERFAAETDPRVAYDIYLEWALTLGFLRNSVSNFRTFQKICQKLVYTDFIMNISADPDSQFFQKTRVSDFIAAHPRTYLLHGGIFAKAVDTLRRAGGIAVPSRLGHEMVNEKGDESRSDTSRPRIELSLDIIREAPSQIEPLIEKLDGLRDELGRLNANRVGDRSLLDNALEELVAARMEAAAQQKVIDQLLSRPS